MSESADLSPAQPGRSWRSIRQDVQPVALSRRGRRRRNVAWLKYAALGLGVALAAWGAYAVAQSWSNDRAALATAVRSEPVREISLITDGTLTKKWVADTLALPKNATLMALDLAALRDRLTANGQVRVAVVARSFPDMLVVTLQERSPVARIQVQDGGRPRQLVVARDGVIYDGFNYDKQLLASMPWLDGVKLTRAGHGYAPIPGMDAVANLLSTAQLNAPHLYREWLIVSLARLEESDEITVRAQDIPQIVFSRREDFFRQIAQLDYVIDAARAQPEAALTQVNLTLGRQVAVQFDLPADQFFKTHPTITTQ
ncbi:MAG: FtsQ-type POTRA domain-containing protein [Opitutae bacterium]|nr:FtsQ-type POTRA domain-containing protein [Opitutae bacterium]